MTKTSYVQKYRAEWVNDPALKWVKPVSNDQTRVQCSWCASTLNARLADLKKHAESSKHLRCKESFNVIRQKKLETVIPSQNSVNKKKKAEASLALFVACHTTMNAVGHLSCLCADKLLDDKIPKIQLQRTKCTGIIKNVWGPHFEEELRDDIGTSSFSLIIDESTDISVLKFLGVAIRYYSEKRGRIVSTFLQLIKLEAGTADAIVKAIEDVIGKLKLDMKKLVGIGTDNASVMVGVNNGVHRKLQDKYNLPLLVLFRCICHSLQLAVSAATAETLPRHLEYAIRETYNWFSHSTLRQQNYAEVYQLINDGASPLKILPLSNTRWLSIQRALDRILNQWIELRTHFEMARRSEGCYTAEVLYKMYKDPVNQVYLTYVHNVVSEVQVVNKAFEAQSADPSKLLDNLQQLLKSISSRILIPARKINIFIDDISKHLDPSPYLGYAFEKALREAKYDEQTKKVVKQRCIDFTAKLCRELQNRLPSNLTLLEKMHLLHPSEALKARVHKLTITLLAREFEVDDGTISKIETQWYNLSNQTWLNGDKSTEEFWVEVSQYTDACSVNTFGDLVKLTFKLLSLPISNAEIERVFSQMNLVKTKLRSRLIPSTVNAILSIRYGLRRDEKCCHTFEVPKQVLKIIGTNATYKNDENEQESNNDDLSDVLTEFQQFSV